MAVKHIPTNVVHSGSKGGTTGCGTNTNEHSDHWVSSGEVLLVIKMVARTKNGKTMTALR